jgi:hypothetical protein
MRRTSTPARAARRLVPLAAAAAALGLSGCQVTNPIQTDEPYVPADGVAVDLDQVQVRNLVVVAESKGGKGTVSGAVVNRSGEPATITFASEGGPSATFRVPAYEQKQISEDGKVSLSSVGAEPGGVVTLQVSTSDSGSNIVDVPVLLPEGYYEELAP